MMAFKVEVPGLKRGVKVANAVINRSKTSPMFPAMIFTIKEKEMLFYATNGGEYIVHREPTDCEEECKFVVSGEIFGKMVSSLKDEEVEIEEKGGYMVLRKGKKSSFKVPLLDPDKIISDDMWDQAVEYCRIPMKSFSSAVKRAMVTFAPDFNKGSDRVRFEIVDSTLRIDTVNNIGATTTYVEAQVKQSALFEVRGQTVEMFLKIFDGSEIVISAAGNRMFFNDGNSNLMISLFTDNLIPDVDDFVQEGKYIEFESKDMADSIGDVSLIFGKVNEKLGKIFEFRCEDEQLYVSAEDQNSYSESTLENDFQCEDFKKHFKGEKVREFLMKGKSKKALVDFGLADENAPAVFKDDLGRLILMPIVRT